MILTKQASRELFLRKRNELSTAENARMSEAIAHKAVEFLAPRSVVWLHSFVSEGGRNEVNTILIKKFISEVFPGIGWVAPRIIAGSRQMEHFVWDADTTMTPNRWGIQEPEPASSRLIDLGLLDMVLVPLLAYDRLGNRVGYGGGYYDRFLPHCRRDAIKVGVSFFDPIDHISDSDDWDVFLDYCITPSSIYVSKP